MLLKKYNNFINDLFVIKTINKKQYFINKYYKILFSGDKSLISKTDKLIKLKYELIMLQYKKYNIIPSKTFRRNYWLAMAGSGIASMKFSEIMKNEK